MRKILVLTLFLALFTGCAWISDGKHQYVSISASDNSKVIATIDGTKVTLPTEYPILRSKGATIHILPEDNPGYKMTEFVIPKAEGINPWYFGNLITGGLVGTTTVDPITGSMWRYANPKFVVPVSKK